MACFSQLAAGRDDRPFVIAGEDNLWVFIHFPLLM